jgi:hypothetical protein
MNVRTEVKEVSRCLTRDVIMSGFLSLPTLHRYLPDLNMRGGMCYCGAVCYNVLNPAWFIAMEIGSGMNIHNQEVCII